MLNKNELIDVFKQLNYKDINLIDNNVVEVVDFLNTNKKFYIIKAKDQWIIDDVLQKLNFMESKIDFQEIMFDFTFDNGDLILIKDYFKKNEAEKFYRQLLPKINMIVENKEYEVKIIENDDRFDY